MPGDPARRRYGTKRRLILGLVAAAIVPCLLGVDRPLALWVDRHITGSALYIAAAALLRPLDGLLIAGLFLLLTAGAWTLAGAHTPAWVSRFIVADLAAILALILTVVLKLAIGRTQVYPAFLREGTYGFHPFGGYPVFAAFPSATMSVSSAFLACLGLRRPPGRTVAGLVLVLLAAALLATSSHWSSDIVAGLWLGLVIGEAVRVARSRQKPRDGPP